MKYLSVFTLLLLLLACSGQTNPLVGKWEFDGDRTLLELEQNPDAPEKLIKCYQNRNCGYNVVITYTDSTWSQYFTFSPETEVDPISYSILTVADGEVEIETREQGEQVKYTVYFLSEDSAYIYSEVDGFRWKEYLRRLH